MQARPTRDAVHFSSAMQTLSFALLVFAAFLLGCSAQCPNLRAPPTGALAKFRPQYRFGTSVWNSDAYVFWTPNIAANSVDFALVLRGGTVNDPSNRDVMCGWAALGYNPAGRGMVGTTAVRAFWNGSSLTQDQVYAPGYVAVPAPITFTAGSVQTDVYGPENKQYMISRFTMRFASLLNSSYMTLSIAARQVDSKLDFHDLFMTQETVSIISGLNYDGFPFRSTDFCNPNVCKAPFGSCAGPFSCRCEAGWYGSQCQQRDLRSSTFLKRAKPSDPTSPIKYLTKFNLDTKIVSDRDISTASPSCSDEKFLNFLQSPTVKVTYSSRFDAILIGSDSIATIRVSYDSKFQQGPTYDLICQAPKTLSKGKIISYSAHDVLINMESSPSVSDFYASDLQSATGMKSLHTAQPIDLTKPIRFASTFGRYSIITEQTVFYGTDNYQPAVTLSSYTLPADAGALNVSCIVASDISDTNIILVQSCDSITVPRVLLLSLGTSSGQVSIKSLGNFGCPSNADGSVLNQPTLLRSEMVSLYSWRSGSSIDTVTNCQFNGRVMPVRNSMAISEKFEVISYTTSLGMAVAQSATDIAAFTTSTW